mgnify:CR=1 FL=1
MSCPSAVDSRAYRSAVAGSDRCVVARGEADLLPRACVAARRFVGVRPRFDGCRDGGAADVDGEPLDGANTGKHTRLWTGEFTAAPSMAGMKRGVDGPSLPGNAMARPVAATAPVTPSNSRATTRFTVPVPVLKSSSWRPRKQCRGVWERCHQHRSRTVSHKQHC